MRSEASRLKTSLLLDMDLLGREGSRDLALLSEVQLFMASLDDVYIQAGPYLSCTHSFVFSFYGILVTYIAILYQSL